MFANARFRVISEGFTSNLLDCICPFGVLQGGMLSSKLSPEFLTDIDLCQSQQNSGKLPTVCR